MTNNDLSRKIKDFYLTVETVSSFRANDNEVNTFKKIHESPLTKDSILYYQKIIDDIITFQKIYKKVLFDAVVKTPSYKDPFHQYVLNIEYSISKLFIEVKNKIRQFRSK